MQKYLDKILNKIININKYIIYEFIIPQSVYKIWKFNLFFRKKRIKSINKKIINLISIFEDQGLVLFKLDKKTFKYIKVINQKLSSILLNLESCVGMNNIIDNNRASFKQYRASLLKLINPILLIKIISSSNIYCFLSNIYPKKNIRITYMDIWLDGINHDSFKQSTETRLFHRDESSKEKNNNIIKFFILLSDVKRKNGPFTYIKYSHKKEARKNDHYLEEANDRLLRYTDQSIEKVYGKENIFYFEGNLGKSVFVDTHHGLHKGTIQEPGSTRVMLAVYFKLE